MRARVKRRALRRPAPKVRRCACHAAREGAKDRIATPGGLMIGGARDPAEARAEARAARALAAPPVVHRKCAACAAEEEARRAPAAGVVAPGTASAPASKAAESAVKSLGPGRPLSAPERGYFEPRLGADLSAVRLHEDAAADRAARAMDAQAFTLGRDVAFARGERGRGGVGLMAHELAHAAEEAPEVRRALSPTSTCGSPPPGMTAAAAVTALGDFDALAMDMCDRADQELSAEAGLFLQNGVRNSDVHRHFQTWYGPARRGRRGQWVSRFSSASFASEAEATASDMLVLAANYRRLAARFANPIIYRCPGRGAYRLPGETVSQPCTPTTFAETNQTANLAVVAICDLFWTPRRSQVAMAATLVHEMAHARLNYNDRAETICAVRDRLPECIAAYLRFRNGEFGDIVNLCRPILPGHPCSEHTATVATGGPP